MTLPQLIEELQAEYGSLERIARAVGVSLQSIFNWKNGKSCSAYHKRKLIDLYNKGAVDETDSTQESGAFTKS